VLLEKGGKRLGVLKRKHPLVWYVGRRSALGVFLVFVDAALVFFCTSVLPGNAASQILGRNATPSSLVALERQLGLNRPVLERFGYWVGGLLHGNLGVSLAAQQPVSSIIGGRITDTLWLALVTMVVLVPLSLALGIISGLRAGGLVDKLISGASLAAISTPEFVVATLLALLFAVKLHLLPPVSLLDPYRSPINQLPLLILPAGTLVAVGLAYTTRMIRAGVIEVMTSDYISMARLNGIKERHVILRHGLRNGMAATVQVVAITLQWLVGGVIVVETVFNYPGIGHALVQAVSDRDIPFVSGVAVIIAAFYIGINIVADLVVVLLIPRLRTSM
jgi:peptide/nickel transport system permease protein